MKILKHGNKQSAVKFIGKCILCGCVVEVKQKETELLVDRDSPEGARHVTCPECKHPYLWVNPKV